MTKLYRLQSPLNFQENCPHCNTLVTLDLIIADGNILNDVALMKEMPHERGGRHITPINRWGIRKCPNIKCLLPVFFTSNGDCTQIYSISPTQTYLFPLDNIPHNVKLSITEAVTCFSNNCYRACIIMIRRALEEICDDNDCIGANLHQRIEALEKKTILPRGLVPSLMKLKLLGNDATHIELKDFDNIGKKEAEIALEITEAIARSLYEYKELESKISSLMKKPEPV